MQAREICSNRLRCKCRVFSHTQIVKNQAHISCELPHCLRYATFPFQLNDADGKTPQPADVFRSMACAYSAAVFCKVPI